MDSAGPWTQTVFPVSPTFDTSFYFNFATSILCQQAALNDFGHIRQNALNCADRNLQVVVRGGVREGVRGRD